MPFLWLPFILKDSRLKSPHNFFQDAFFSETDCDRPQFLAWHNLHKEKSSYQIKAVCYLKRQDAEHSLVVDASRDVAHGLYHAKCFLQLHSVVVTFRGKEQVSG